MMRFYVIQEGSIQKEVPFFMGEENRLGWYTLKLGFVGVTALEGLCAFRIIRTMNAL